jgi:hypothetical protein
MNQKYIKATFLGSKHGIVDQNVCMPKIQILNMTIFQHKHKKIDSKLF